MSRKQYRYGFTLIELLVVITIIVVLLALLTPALDKAIYQAELTLCGAQMKGIASGVSSYAFANKRFYPRRTTDNPHYLAGWGSTDGSQDDRPRLRDYVSLRAMIDPFCDTSIDLDAEAQINPYNFIVFASYYLLYDFGYANHKRKRRVGDRMTFTQNPGTANEQIVTYPWLVADFDYTGNGIGQTLAGHPDTKGLMSIETYQNETYEGANTQEDVILAGFEVTGTTWRFDGDVDRGTIDTNAAGDDGSVLRFNAVDWDRDPRTGQVPRTGGNNDTTLDYYQLPRAWTASR